MSQYSQVNSSLLDSNGIDQDASLVLARTAALAADDRKGDNILIIRVAEVSYLADYFAIITGFSKVHVRAIAESIKEKVEQECERVPVRQEGQESGTWQVLDYGDIIVHVLMPNQREYYNLEAFWGHAERVEFSA